MLRDTLQPRSQRQTEHGHPHGVPLLDTAGARDRPGLPGVHPKNQASRSCTVTLGH